MEKNKFTLVAVVLLLALFICGCGKIGSDSPEDSERVSSQVVSAPETDFKVTNIGEGVCIVGYLGNGGDINIPDTIGGKPVTQIGFMPFYGVELTSVTIPDSVTRIGDSAFNKTLLTDVMLPESVTDIAERAFLDCEQLKSINIPQGVTQIKKSTFSGCTSLTDITIPDAVTEIGEFAFSRCTSLTTITLPDNMQAINKRAFYDCPYITVTYRGTSYTYDTLEELYSAINKEESTSPDIPLDTFFRYEDNEDGIVITSAVGWMGTGFYSGEEGIVDIPGKIDGKPVTEIGSNAFISCNDVTVFTIPDSVTRIGNGAFVSCKNVTEFILPLGITEIANNTFSECTSLRDISIPSGVTRIGDLAFRACTSLNVIIIPDGVTEIGYAAFMDCTDLDLVGLPDSMSSIKESTFENCENLTVIYKGTLYKYEEINNLYDAINNQ